MLANVGDAVSLSSLDQPFEIFIVLRDGSVRTYVDSAHAALAVAGHPGKAGPHWVGLRTLVLDGTHMVQVLSDVRSDRRAMRVYDSFGIARFQKALDVPLAFIASDPRSNTLIAIRRTNQSDVVTYHWVWTQAARGN